MNVLNISPIDGRYQNKTDCLKNYFSEYGLIRYRLKIEIEYLIYLIKLLKLPYYDDINKIREIFINFDIEDCIIIKK